MDTKLLSTLNSDRHPWVSLTPSVPQLPSSSFIHQLRPCKSFSRLTAHIPTDLPLHVSVKRLLKQTHFISLHPAGPLTRCCRGRAGCWLATFALIVCTAPGLPLTMNSIGPPGQMQSVTLPINSQWGGGDDRGGGQRNSTVCLLHQKQQTGCDEDVSSVGRTYSSSLCVW